MARTCIAASIVLLLASLSVRPSVLPAQSQSPPPPAAAGREQVYALLENRIGEVVRIRTSSGGEFTGRLYRLLEDRLELVNSEGQIVQVAADEIATALVIERTQDSRSYYQDAAANRLLLMPTAFGMEPGEFHIAVQEIVAITASYGASSFFSLWGGISIPGALVNARFSVPLGGAAAVSAGSFLGVSWFQFFGIAMPYVISSIGSPTQSFTFGAALPVFADSKGVSIAGAVAGLAGKIVLSRTAAIVTENWFILGADGGTWDGTPFLAFPTVAFRIAGSRFSWDIGATFPFMIDTNADSGALSVGGLFGGVFVPLPILSFTYRIK